MGERKSAYRSLQGSGTLFALFFVEGSGRHRIIRGRQRPPTFFSIVPRKNGEVWFSCDHSDSDWIVDAPLRRDVRRSDDLASFKKSCAFFYIYLVYLVFFWVGIDEDEGDERESKREDMPSFPLPPLPAPDACASLPIVVSTWNIEHHGFTRNSPDGTRPGGDGTSSHPGYSETPLEFQIRLNKVFDEMTSNGMQGLVGLNEIGLGAFPRVRSFFPSSYKVFASSVLQAGFEEDASSPPCSREQEEVYGNVAAVDTARWSVVEHEHVTFPDTRTTRSNTALVTVLRDTRPGDAVHSARRKTREIVWIHTHLKWNPRDPEREGQVRTIRHLVERYADLPVIISGDLYLPVGCTSLTEELGLRKVHEERTQSFDRPHDPDQILVPDTLEVRRVDFLGDFKRRRQLSDHSGVRVVLEFGGQ